MNDAPDARGDPALLAAFPRHLAPITAPIFAELPETCLAPIEPIARTGSRWSDPARPVWPDPSVEGEKPRIPYRIYNPEPSETFLADLDVLERLLLACLYTRNHDGFVRQRNLAPSEFG
ncbi:hypothetical protein [Sciscionella marina]|uniref:hypothetical protein n=1 Tax=Sciscionella marina TaxID=508770 RepID=UPI000375E288|nr:hypothetical protein [Sciscionella marina]